MTLPLTLSALTAFVAVAFLTPIAGLVAHRLGMISHPSANRAHRTPTPHLGGAAILLGLVVAILLAKAMVPPHRQAQLEIILVGAVVLGLVGLVDDRWPKLPRYRLVVEVLVAGGAILSGIQMGVSDWAWLNVVLTLLWIVGITNAVNLLDNMDGLASGAVAIAAGGAAVLGVENGQTLQPLMAVALAAAMLGFLVHNRPPARIFMGDAGSLPIGFLLAITVAKLNLVSSPGPLRLAIVAQLCGVGILDTALVVISRLRRHLSPFEGGTDHSSHRLVRSGLSPAGAVLVLHMMSAWFVASAILLRHWGPEQIPVAIAIPGVVSAAALWALLRLPAEGPLSTAGRPERRWTRGPAGRGPRTPARSSRANP